MPNKAARFGIKLIAVGAIGWALIRLMRVSLIINYGISATNLFTTAFMVLFACGAVVMLLGFSSKLKLVAASADDSKRSDSLKSGSLNTTKVIKKELQRLQVTAPALSTEFDSLLAQMDRMDRRQAQLDEMLRISGTKDNWSGVVDLLNSVEQVICQNLKVVILHGIALDKNDSTTAESVTKYSKILVDQKAKNAKLLDECEETLNHVADLISGNTGSDDVAELDAYLEVLRSMVKQNKNEGEKV